MQAKIKAKEDAAARGGKGGRAFVTRAIHAFAVAQRAITQEAAGAGVVDRTPGSRGP